MVEGTNSRAAGRYLQISGRQWSCPCLIRVPRSRNGERPVVTNLIVGPAAMLVGGKSFYVRGVRLIVGDLVIICAMMSHFFISRDSVSSRGNVLDHTTKSKTSVMNDQTHSGCLE